MARGTAFKPLKMFDYRLVQEKFEGLLINIDRDLQRRARESSDLRNLKAGRCLVLLNVIVRFARNAYRAMGYLMAQTPEDPSRSPTYALVLPPVNRQLLDLLFSLVYMLDDFEARSLQYQRAGWREARNELHKFKTEFSRDPEWQPFFQNFKRGLETLIPLLGISAEEQKDPSLIPYWKHPGELKDEKTKSRPFLRWLDKWLYGDTSAQAHLSFGGLFMVSPFLVAELVGGQSQEIVEDRMIHQYRFQHFSRTAFVTLAIVTEIDSYCKLGNRAAISYLWTMFAEHASEGKEMYRKRYEALLSSEPAA
jgi:hypothetical protein